MKRLLLSTAIVVALAAGGGYAYKAAADNPNAPPGGPAFPPGPPGPFAGGWGPPGGPGGPGGPPPWGKWRDKDKTFGLFAEVPNKNLSPADVKTIAGAILLEHGNHDWTVINIAAQTDKSIEFSYATQHGDIIATFALDPATGRIQRIS